MCIEAGKEGRNLRKMLFFAASTHLRSAVYHPSKLPSWLEKYDRLVHALFPYKYVAILESRVSPYVSVPTSHRHRFRTISPPPGV